MNYLVFSSDKELLRLRCDKIIYVASDGNYSTIFMADGDKRVVTIQLGQIERLMSEQLGKDGECFIRIGRTLIINQDFIYYINPVRQQLILSDSQNFTHTLSASREALRAVKEYLEGKLPTKG